MAKITGKYEVLYIIDPAQGEEGIAALVEKFKAMVEVTAILGKRIRVTLLEFIIDNVTEVVTLSLLK